jgi:hypothetical protein
VPEWREVRDGVAAERQTRAAQLAGRGAIVSWLEELLFRHDPVGIDFEDNTDEYRPEAETITLRLSEPRTEAELVRVIHEEFVRWFGPDTAGPADRYVTIAEEVWRHTRDSPH